MNPDTNLIFIKERITEIGSALFYSTDHESCKASCSIITVLNIDDNGHLWFFTKRPFQHLSQYEKTFPARLSFYRKGKPFFIQVSGIATLNEDSQLVNHFAGMHNDTAANAMQALMLVKLKMKKAEYHEPKEPKVRKNLIHQLQEYLPGLFKPSYGYRSFEVNTELI